MEGIRPSFEELFERVVNYPDFEYQERLNELVGLEQHKDRLIKILSLLVNPSALEKWAKRYHIKATKAINYVLKRPPLVILEGDVGSGKTELALTIGDSVARKEKIDIQLLPLSLTTRGEGRVGQMTRLITAAFDYAIEKAENHKNQDRKSRGAVILLVDEADALTQSRENEQMHHEDRAGVNSFIRGVDRIGNGKLPAAVVLCTNRINALDPAIKRRAADILRFDRPDEDQRRSVLFLPLMELGLTDKEIDKIAFETGKSDSNKHSFTYSDITQRLLPAIVLDAFPNKKVTAEQTLEIVKKMQPTPPFNDK